jgi:hypothetical protein
MTRFASLTAGLLARKGEAEPASTPFADQMFTRVGASGPDMNAQAVPRQEAFAVRAAAPRQAFRFLPPVAAEAVEPPPFIVPPPPPVLPDEDMAEQRCAPCAAPPGEDMSKTFHVNLRLKRPRFVKLKLSAALLRRPAQDIVSEALDQWFEKLPPEVLGDCACMRGGSD